ncbi:MAG TPA: hypothetical protein PK230_13485 [Chitinophagales bacterium]|nr:hypothetical protein [Chitinophagales bacterium]
MEYQKIAIEFNNALFDGYGIETIWATPVGEHYLDNIPNPMSIMTRR